MGKGDLICQIMSNPPQQPISKEEQGSKESLPRKRVSSLRQLSNGLEKISDALEQNFDCFLQRLEDLVIFVFMLGIFWGAYRWWISYPNKKPLNLSNIIEEFSKHWQGGIIVVLIILMPTIRKLVDRIKTIPIPGLDIEPSEKEKKRLARNQRKRTE